MNAAELLPPVPSPPHDPRSLLLSPVAGWRLAQSDGVEISPTDGALVLPLEADSGRQLIEPGGTFGGLVAPRNIASTSAGDVYLLDAGNASLKRFDPCTCRFETLPCLGGKGRGPRQFGEPVAILVHCGNLLVSDVDHRCVRMFSLRGLAFRGALAPPADAGLAQPWMPRALAADSRRRLLVADPANSAVHVFSPRGRWQKAMAVGGAVSAIGVDRCDRLYVLIPGEPSVRVFGRDGVLTERAARLDAVADRFERLPFAVGPDRRIALTDRCVAAGGELPDGGGWFDATGEPTKAPVASTPAYRRDGEFLSVAIDSRVDSCVWDRLELDVVTPPMTAVEVQTYTSNADRPLALLLDLPPGAWTTRQVVPSGVGGKWDCLIRGEPGRYLWLRLLLRGRGTATPRVRGVRIEFPRISLRRYLSAAFGGDSVSAEFTDRFLSIFDRTFRDIERQIDWQAQLFDPGSTPAESLVRGTPDFLSWLASWIGVVFDRMQPTRERRRLLGAAARLFPIRGTVRGLREQLYLFLGWDRRRCRPPRQQTCTGLRSQCGEAGAAHQNLPPLILEHFQLRRWLFVGAGRLGERSRLWGWAVARRTCLGEGARAGATRLDARKDPQRDPFHVLAHAFTVLVPAWVRRSPHRRRALDALLAAERPAHVACRVEFVEPRMRIGIQASIGLNTVVGRYPAAAALDGLRLGRGSMVGGPSPRGPSIQLDVEGRIGTTTRIT